MRPIQPIRSQESPREILEADFPSLRGRLPIHGGWGYHKEDACIIDRNDPVVPPGLPFDYVNLEHAFVEKRLYEELIIFRPKGEQFSGIQWQLQEQSLQHEANGRVFDHLTFTVTALPDRDWDTLKAEYEGPHGHAHPAFDADAHQRKRQGKTLHFTREYWFDITNCLTEPAP